MCLGTPNSNTRSELEVHLHARYLTVVLDSCVPIALHWRFRTTEQLAVESSFCASNRSRCLSLCTASASRSPEGLMFDMFVMFTLIRLPPGRATNYLFPPGAPPPLEQATTSRHTSLPNSLSPNRNTVLQANLPQHLQQSTTRKIAGEKHIHSLNALCY